MAVGALVALGAVAGGRSVSAAKIKHFGRELRHVDRHCRGDFGRGTNAALGGFGNERARPR